MSIQQKMAINIHGFCQTLNLVRKEDTMLNAIKKFMTEEDGATAVEYGLLVALIAAGIVAIVGTLGDQVEAGFQSVSDELPAAAAAE